MGLFVRMHSLLLLCVNAVFRKLSLSFQET